VAALAEEGCIVTSVPSLYGDLTPEAEIAYSRWITALFNLTDHVSWCTDDCRDADYRCAVGKRLYAVEQSTWELWKEARG
jgi:hypothetical protein